jgi:hypothetical protein
VNNYYKWGPATGKNVKRRVFNPFKREDIPFGKFYVNGNYVDDFPDVSANNWLGVTLDKGTDADAAASKLEQPFPSIEINTQTAAAAYDAVLQRAGASLPMRDTLDQRIIKDVMNRTGRLIDVQGGFPHGTPYEQSKGAWPALRSLPAPADTDQDGMPDEWERKNGLNANDASDAVGYKLSKQYTNIEMYINGLVK